MYKMIIVDDELLVQVGIKSMLDWSNEDIAVVGMASNGDQAYELILKEMPDIVITDIKMPVMDGLELMSKCKENLTNIPQFILLSSHEDFAYAKKALKLGAIEYLIKLEINEEVLKEAINLAKSHSESSTVKQKLKDEMKNESIQNKRIYKRLINNLIDEKDIPNIAAQIEVDLCDELFILCFEMQMRKAIDLCKSEEERVYECVINTTTELINKEYKGYVVPTDRYNFFAILHNDNNTDEDIIKGLINDLILRIIHVNGKYFNVNLQVGCSKFSHTIVSIPAAFDEARQALNYISENKTVVFFTDIEQYMLNMRKFDVTIFTKQIDIAFKQGDSNEIKRTFEIMLDLFKTENPIFEQTLDCCYKILYFILATMENGEQIIEETYSGNHSGYTYIGNLKNVGEALEWLVKLSNSICAEVSSQNIDYSKRIAGKTKAYIEENICEKLTLNEVAEELGVSTGYLSIIFKRYNDIGFSDYVSKSKIEYAMNILKEGTYKIYEVAEIVGYDNAYYFSKVFKKMVGITPKEYVARLN